MGVVLVLVASACDDGGDAECAEDRDCSEAASCVRGRCAMMDPPATPDGGARATIRQQPSRTPARMDAGAPASTGDGGAAPRYREDAILDPGSLDHADTLAELDARGAFAVRVVVPDDAHAFVLTATPPGPDFEVELSRVTGPSGTLFPPSPLVPPAQGYLPDVGSGTRGMPYSLMLPNRPELELERGVYTVIFQLWQYGTALGVPPTVSVDVTWTRGAAEPAGGRLDLLLLVIPDQEWDADRVLNDPTFTRAIEHANTLFAPAGIEIDEVAGVDLAAEAEDLDTALLGTLLVEHAARAPTAVRLVLIEHEHPGTSFGVPGAPGRTGLYRSSAIAVGPSVLSWPADIAGRLLAHEIGHHLGLSHVTEMDHRTHDQLLDTPECEPEQPASEEDAGTAADDACAEARRNVMYWEGFHPLPLEDVHFSQDQIWVMRRSPFLH
jgi:hypothetical protein